MKLLIKIHFRTLLLHFEICVIYDFLSATEYQPLEVTKHQNMLHSGHEKRWKTGFMNYFLLLQDYLRKCQGHYRKCSTHPTEKLHSYPLCPRGHLCYTFKLICSTLHSNPASLGMFLILTLIILFLFQLQTWSTSQPHHPYPAAMSINPVVSYYYYLSFV